MCSTAIHNLPVVWSQMSLYRYDNLPWSESALVADVVWVNTHFVTVLSFVYWQHSSQGGSRMGGSLCVLSPVGEGI